MEHETPPEKQQPEPLIEQVLALVDPSGRRSKSKLARRLNVDRQLVARWQTHKYIPAYLGFEVEKITGGKITAREICDEERKRLKQKLMKRRAGK